MVQQPQSLRTFFVLLNGTRHRFFFLRHYAHHVYRFDVSHKLNGINRVIQSPSAQQTIKLALDEWGLVTACQVSTNE